jgi:hypothetical protein
MRADPQHALPADQKVPTTSLKRATPNRQWWAYEHPEPELANSMDTIMIGVSSEALAKLIKLKLGSDKGTYPRLRTARFPEFDSQFARLQPVQLRDADHLGGARSILLYLPQPR